MSYQELPFQAILRKPMMIGESVSKRVFVGRNTNQFTMPGTATTVVTVSFDLGVRADVLVMSSVYMTTPAIQQAVFSSVLIDGNTLFTVAEVFPSGGWPFVTVYFETTFLTEGSHVADLRIYTGAGGVGTHNRSVLLVLVM